MASYKVIVVNERERPLKGVRVEALKLADLTVTSTVSTDDAGEASFSNITGPHFFRPLTRRVSTKVGEQTFTGEVKVQLASLGENMNVDYVVDSNGMGTHAALFGASGALAAALTAGGRKTIWLCTTHTEPTVTTTHTLGAQVASKIITIWGAPGARSLLPIDAGSATSFFTYINCESSWILD